MTVSSVIHLACLIFKGDKSNKWLDAKLHGLKLAYYRNSLQILRRLYTSLIEPVPHFEPPTALNKTASTFLATSKASSGKGTRAVSKTPPPLRWCWNLNLTFGRTNSMAFKTLMFSLVISLRKWSPRRTTIFLAVFFFFLFVYVYNILYKIFEAVLLIHFWDMKSASIIIHFFIYLFIYPSFKDL